MKTEGVSMPAQKHLAQRQRRYPPRYQNLSGSDRVQQLYQFLAPELPEALRALVADGTLVIGEIGHNVPDVRMIPISPNGFVIEFTSGMMDFQYAVARALAGLDQENAKLEEQPLRLLDVTSLVEKVLRQWARYIRWFWLWPWRRIEIPNFPIARGAQEWIEMMVTMGELFLLAHELGHVALESGLVNPVSGGDEVDADRYGLKFLLPAAKRHWHERIAYAGPIVPIRILASLERLGVKFSKQYPPQAERVRLLREQVSNICPSKEYFYEATTVMVSWQDMMDDIENHIDPKSPPAFPDTERLLVRLIAELEEVSRGNVTIDRFIEDIEHLAKSYPQKTIKQAAILLVSHYMQLPPPPNIFLRKELRTLMAGKLTELIAKLPPHLRLIFPP